MTTPPHDDDLDWFPELSVARGKAWGHVVRPHELLGQACIRCGRYDPAWVLTDEGCWR